jgi:hypothetical protein
MAQPERFYWRVTWDDATGERAYKDRIGPFTISEVEDWASAEIDATTRLRLNFHPIEPAE